MQNSHTPLILYFLKIAKTESREIHVWPKIINLLRFLRLGTKCDIMERQWLWIRAQQPRKHRLCLLFMDRNHVSPEISNFPCFFRLGTKCDVMESNRLRIRTQRPQKRRVCLLRFLRLTTFLWSCVFII